jgi:hypothetical protein
LGEITKAEKVTRITEIFDSYCSPPLLGMWREENEERLRKLENPEIDLAKNTAVGRKSALMK